MNHSPKLSVCIPVYNVEKFIVQCARSCFEQSLYDMEFIFVDDCSPDKSIELLQELLTEYPHRKDQVKIIRHEQNNGLFETRKDALNAANGKYLWCVDSDDFIHPQAAEALYECAEKNSAEIVIFDVNIAYGKECFKRINCCRNNRDLYLKALISGETFPSMCNKLIARDFYFQSDILQLPGINYSEDYLVSSQLLKKTEKVAFLAQAYYNYFVNPQSLMQKFRWKWVEDNVLVLKTVSEIYQRDLPEADYQIYFTKMRRNMAILAVSSWANSDDRQYSPQKIKDHYSVSWKELFFHTSIPYKIMIIFAVCKCNFLMRCYVKCAVKIKRFFDMKKSC